MVKRLLNQGTKNTICWGSILLNVVLIGFIGFGVFHFKPMPPGPPSPDKMFEHMGRNLEGADKVAFQQILAKHRFNLRSGGDEIHQALENIGQKARTDSLDIDGVKAAHSHFHAKQQNLNLAIESFIYEVLLTLSDEGRQSLQFGPPDKPPHK